MQIDVKSIQAILKNQTEKIMEKKRLRKIISHKITGSEIIGKDEAEVQEDEEENKTIIDPGRTFIKSESSMNTVRDHKLRPLPPLRTIIGDMSNYS